MYFPNERLRRGLLILDSWKGMGRGILPSGEPIYHPLLDKASRENDIRGVPTPSSAIGGHPDLGS